MVLREKRINSNEIHIWYTFTDEVYDPELLKTYFAIINSDELTKINRYMFEKDRHSCLLTRALIRYTLSKYINKKPELWEFSTNKYGKPALKGDTCNQNYQFNISHTKGLIVLALTTSGSVGIDVEGTNRNIIDRNKTDRKKIERNRIDRKKMDIDIAERFFSPSEAIAIKNAASENRTKLFLDFWTLKESYIKARGMGLSIPLDKFYFTITNKNIRINFTPEINDKPENWQFFKFNIADNHNSDLPDIIKNESLCNITSHKDFHIKYKMSIAINSPQHSPCQLKFFRCVPFQYEKNQ